MPDDDLSSLARDIDARCRLRGTFTLRSGQVSDEYFDKYLFESDPSLMRRVVSSIVPCVPGETELLGGLELGGIPLVTLLSQETGLPALFVRKTAKTYGTARLAEGGDPSGRLVTLVEDVITTGGAVVNAADALRSLGAMVTTVVCVIDRAGDLGSELLRGAGIDVRSVLTKELLDSVRAVLCRRSLSSYKKRHRCSRMRYFLDRSDRELPRFYSQFWMRCRLGMILGQSGLKKPRGMADYDDAPLEEAADLGPDGSMRLPGHRAPCGPGRHSLALPRGRCRPGWQHAAVVSSAGRRGTPWHPVHSGHRVNLDHPGAGQGQRWADPPGL